MIFFCWLWWSLLYNMSYCFYKMKSKCLLTKYFFRFMQTPYTIVISVRRILFLTYTRTYNDYRKSPMQITATSDSFFFIIYIVLRICVTWWYFWCTSASNKSFKNHWRYLYVKHAWLFHVVFLLFLKTAVKSHSSGIYFKY